LTIRDDLSLDSGTASLAGAGTETGGEAAVRAVALDIARSAAELGVCLVDHAGDAVFTALRDGTEVLSSDGGHEGGDSEDELHGEGLFVWWVRRVCLREKQDADGKLD